MIAEKKCMLFSALKQHVGKLTHAIIMEGKHYYSGQKKTKTKTKTKQKQKIKEMKKNKNKYK